MLPETLAPILDADAVAERADDLRAAGLNGLRMALVSLGPPAGADEARLEVFFLNPLHLADVLADATADPSAAGQIFQVRGGQRLRAGPGAGEVKCTAVEAGSTDADGEPISLILTLSPIGDYSTYTLELRLRPRPHRPVLRRAPLPLPAGLLHQRLRAGVGARARPLARAGDRLPGEGLRLVPAHPHRRDDGADPRLAADQRGRPRPGADRPLRRRGGRALRLPGPGDGRGLSRHRPQARLPRPPRAADGLPRPPGQPGEHLARGDPRPRRRALLPRRRPPLVGRPPRRARGVDLVRHPREPAAPGGADAPRPAAQRAAPPLLERCRPRAARREHHGGRRLRGGGRRSGGGDADPRPDRRRHPASAAGGGEAEPPHGPRGRPRPAKAPAPAAAAGGGGGARPPHRHLGHPGALGGGRRAAARLQLRHPLPARADRRRLHLPRQPAAGAPGAPGAHHLPRARNRAAARHADGAQPPLRAARALRRAPRGALRAALRAPRLPAHAAGRRGPGALHARGGGGDRRRGRPVGRGDLASSTATTARRRATTSWWRPTSCSAACCASATG